MYICLSNMAFVRAYAGVGVTLLSVIACWCRIMKAYVEMNIKVLLHL